jgi:hypothetical protein
MDLELTMLSMVSANRFIYIGAILLVAAAYAVFLWIDHNHNDHIADIKRHIQDIENSGSVDGLVFGGSNAYYSLSAESLSYHTGARWYNASMIQEMQSINRYEDFIQDLAARIDRTKVKYVVYSSILPHSDTILAYYKVDKKTKGEGIKPKTSVLGYINNFAGSGTGNSEARNSFGDIVFDRVECDLTAENAENVIREVTDISVDFLIDRAIYFASIFPNASISIVLPSGYYGGHIVDYLIFERTLRTRFYTVLSEKHFKNATVKIIFQPPYPSITQLCDNTWHANENGRVWRTQNLIELMGRGLSPRLASF